MSRTPQALVRRLSPFFFAWLIAWSLGAWLGWQGPLGVASAWAAVPSVEISRPVSDYANVMDARAIGIVEHALRAHENATENQIAILLIGSLEREPIEDYAHRTAIRWGGGKKGVDNGILVVISIADRSSRIEVGYGLEQAVPDAVAKTLLDGLRPALRAGDYTSAVAQIANQLMERTGGKPGIALRTLTPERAPVPLVPSQLPGPRNSAGSASTTQSSPPTEPGGHDAAFLAAVLAVIALMFAVIYRIVRPRSDLSAFQATSSGSSDWPSGSASSGSPGTIFGAGSGSSFGAGSSWSSNSSSSGSSSSGSSSSGYSGGGGSFGGGGASSSW